MTIRGLLSSGIGDRLTAAVMLIMATLAVGLLPFHMLIRTAGTGTASPRRDPAHWKAEMAARAVESMSRRMPWRTVCIHEGLALHWMLRRRAIPSVLHFGVDPGNDRLSAHVWVSLDGKILIGEAAAGRHAQVATFPGSA